MEKKQILEMVEALSPVEIPAKLENADTISGIDGGAHFVATRGLLRETGQDALLFSVYGSVEERCRLLAEFCEVFGTPYESRQDFEDPDQIDTALWAFDKALI